MFEVTKVHYRLWHNAEIKEAFQIHEDGVPLRHLINHITMGQPWYVRLRKCMSKPLIVEWETQEQAEAYILARTTELPPNESITQSDATLASDAVKTLDPRKL